MQPRLQQNKHLSVVRPGMLAVGFLFITQSFSQPTAMLEKALSRINAVKTLQCAIVRKQTFKGVNKIAKCDFYFDRQQGKFSYVYASPYAYSFWVDDAAICGVSRTNNEGYRASAGEDPSRYGDLIGSVHLCRQLFQLSRRDAPPVSLKARINQFLYFERSSGEEKEVIQVDLRINSVTLIETFTTTGKVLRQTFFVYAPTKGKPSAVPQKIITREIKAGIIETDELFFTNVEINKNIQPAVFLPPMYAGISVSP